MRKSYCLFYYQCKFCGFMCIYVFQESEDKQIEIQFNFTVRALEGKKTYLAFQYPFSYKECQQHLKYLSKKYSKDKEIYYHHETLILSPEQRKINLITISSYDKMIRDTESQINDNLFPFCQKEKRSNWFPPEKMIVFISARVHAGESPSSFVAKGILKFLLNK